MEKIKHHNSKKIHVFFSVVSVIALLIFISCDNTSTDGNDLGVAGTFELQTVDGEELPMVPSNHWDLLVSQLLKLEGTTFTISTVMSELNDEGEVDRTYNLFEQGTYTVSGSMLTFVNKNRLHDDDFWTGTMTGSTITVTHDHGDMGSSVFVFTKQ